MPELEPNSVVASKVNALDAMSDLERNQILAERMKRVPRKLTENDSSFERRRLHAAVATALVGTGAPPERVEQEIAKMLETGAVVTLDHDVWGHEIFSTPELLAIEREIVSMARRLNRMPGLAPNAATIEELIAKRPLSLEQKAAIRAATRGLTISIAEGAPGSGKTTILEPIKDAWQAAGFRVIGSATA